MHSIRPKPALLLTTALAAILILTGCDGAASDQSTQSAAGDSAGSVANEAGTADRAVAPDQGQALGGGEAKDTPAQAPDLSVDQRSIIYRGSLSVRVQDVTAAAGQANGVATTAGGFVGGDNRSSGTGSDSATMELRVPAAKFGAVVDQLSKLGKEDNREISTEDVTEQTVDLDARIAVQQARVDSGRKLLSQAKSLNDLVMLEREVATRESDLASLQGKKRRLADLTALSTISVTFLGPQATVKDPDDGPPGFLSGLGAGWKALITSLTVLLTVLGAVLPWLLAFGLPAWAIFWAIRRYRRSSGPAPALATGGAPALATTGPASAENDNTENTKTE